MRAIEDEKHERVMEREGEGKEREGGEVDRERDDGGREGKRV